MKALDTNVLVRLLVNDDPHQARRVTDLFTTAEEEGIQFVVPTLVLLELIWVLESVYQFSRNEILEACELVSQMPVLSFENYAVLQRLIVFGRTTNAHLADLLIGLTGQSCGGEVTLTFEKGLEKTGLFERI